MRDQNRAIIDGALTVARTAGAGAIMLATALQDEQRSKATPSAEKALILSVRHFGHFMTGMLTLPCNRVNCKR